MRRAPTRTERQATTRRELLDAAERLFEEQGFAATSLGLLADRAGYTKGAVYSNFVSKEDVFFAVYERRVERFLADVAHAESESADEERMAEQVMVGIVERREGGDGWLAVFLEFWTHVLRHPEHRRRFAAIHARATEPAVANIRRLAAAEGVELPVDAHQLATALFAMTTALGLERLTDPENVDKDLVVHMQQIIRSGLLEVAKKVPGSVAGA
jgi:AcrR family transcriptional regulator